MEIVCREWLVLGDGAKGMGKIGKLWPKGKRAGRRSLESGREW